MKIAIAQINPLIGAFAENCAKIRNRTSEASQAGCELVIFPELAVSGYPPRDLLERPSFIDDHDRALTGLIAEIRDIAVITGAITRHTTNPGKALHNSAILFENGRVLETAIKRLLPSYDVFDESRYFEPGGQGHPVRFRDLTLILTICEDIWNDKEISERQLYPLDPVEELLNQAGGRGDLLINLAASPFRRGKNCLKQKIFQAISHKYQLPILYANQVGGQDSLLFDGRSLAVNKFGEIIATAESFQEDLLVLDTADLHRPDPSESDEHARDNEVPDIHRALVMGTGDYVRKCGFSRGLLGLSGGIDSALTAAIAAAALGPENLMGIALPSPYSSRDSIDDARELAENLGITFEVLPINEIFKVQMAALQPLLGELNHDVTEQNIQARIRGNLLMAISNKTGAMLLSTGNKSELAVGYCTLYGDMSGGLAVISDVPKQLVYQLAEYINRDKIIIPARTISKPPSAELAPNQLDQDDLPPYETLDRILTAWLEENMGIKEIIAEGFNPELVKSIIRRVRINEYKRKQAPLGLKVTSKAFGYGRRYPTAENYRESS